MADAHDSLDILQAAARIAAAHLDGVLDRPVWQPVPQRLRAELADQALPEQGLDQDRLLELLERDVLAYPMGNGHPAFFGWVNAAPHPAGIAGALLGAAMNPSSAGGDHGDVYLERAAVRWIAELIGFPHEPGAGLLTSGASMATIVAVGAARRRALDAVGWDVRERGLAGAPRLVAYGSEEVHSCVRKAIELLGIGSANLHAVPVDAQGHLEVAALRRAIAADRAAGAVPFLVAGSAGTVSTGAIDDLDALAAVCAEQGLWFHVDGAYGGLGVLDPAIAHRYAGMDRADSVALDPHKWLQVPAGVGCVLVRDRRQLRETFSYVPSYLRDDAAGELGWYSEYGIEQTRPPRALPVWAAIAARGRTGVAADITACTSTARLLGAMVERDPEFELAAPVESSIVAFRYAPADLGPQQADELTRAAATAVQAGGRAFVTDSVFLGRPVLRACLINPATGPEDLGILLAEVRAAAASRRAGH